jgi:hypothetical protein
MRITKLVAIALGSFIGCAQSVPDNNWGFDSKGDDPGANASATSGDPPATTSDDDTSSEDDGESTSGDPPAQTSEGETSSGDGDASSSDDGTPAQSSEGGDVETFDYGRCSDGCPAEMCMTIDGFDGSFCSIACEDGACPQPTEGEATGQCLLGPDLAMPPVNCVLTCSVAAQDCPGEMACVDAMMGGDAGICLWQ